MFQANGAAGGQTVFHFHLHVLPRRTGDGLSIAWQRNEPGMQTLNAHAERLHRTMA